MTVTLYHIIVPPIVAVLSIALIVVLFRRAAKRGGVRPTVQAPESAPAAVNADGSAAVNISQSDSHDGHSGDTRQKIEERLSMEEQIAEREKMLIKRITANPRDAEAYDLLGQVYLVQGSLQDAAECFQQVVAFDPRNLRAVEQLNKIKKIMQSK